MSSVLDRPDIGLDEPPVSSFAVIVRGACAAAAAVAIGAAIMLVIALIVWSADSRSGGSAGQAARTGLALWLLAVRTPLHVTGGSIEMPPLGLTVIIGWVLARSASTLVRWTEPDDDTARSLGEIWEIVLAIALPYAALTTVVAVIARTGPLRPSSAGAFAGALVLAAIASVIGAIRAGGLSDQLDSITPPWLTAGLASAKRACFVVLGVATALVLGSLLVHAGRISTLSGQAGHGLVATGAIVILDLVLLPNAILAAVGYLVGPGFAVGTGTSVGVGAVHLGSQPPLPLLAALPHGAAPFLVRVALIIAILVAGVVAGRASTESLSDAVAQAAVASLICGVGIGVLAGLAGGPAGPGGLATVGASGWQTSLMLSLELAGVAVVTAAACAAGPALLDTWRDA